VLVVTSLEQKSVTIDEYGYLPAAYNLVSTGELRFSDWHTPLVNFLLGLPLIGAEVEPAALPAGTPAESRYWFWNNGRWFAQTNAERYHELLIRTRLMSVALAMALGVLVYRWAIELASPLRDRVSAPAPGAAKARVAGAVAAALVLFHPEVLAHSRFTTLDVGLTFFFTLSLYAFHRYVRAPSFRGAAFVGVTLGLAQASKFTSLLLIPVMLGLPLAAMVLPATFASALRGASRRTLCGHLALAAGVALLVLHATYLFDEPLTGPDSFEARSEQMQGWQDRWPAWLKAPIPTQYLRAVDHQLADQERRYQCYLLGETIRGGRIDYFAVLLWAKTPMAGVLLLIACTGLYLWRGAPRRLESFVLLAPALLVVLTFSLSNKQIGLRMVLPAIPLVAIWVAGVSPWLLAGKRWMGFVVAAVLLFVVSSISVHPHYLSYFNLASGGTANGYRVGLGSNYDWGQDLPALAAWMERRGVDEVDLLYYGRIDPAVYGIDYSVPTRLTPGSKPLVVSASHYGMQYPVPDHGQRRSMDIPARRDQIFDNERVRFERIAPSLFVFERP
jgi:hypothetical protein